LAKFNFPSSLVQRIFPPYIFNVSWSAWCRIFISCSISFFHFYVLLYLSRCGFSSLYFCPSVSPPLFSSLSFTPIFSLFVYLPQFFSLCVFPYSIFSLSVNFSPLFLPSNILLFSLCLFPDYIFFPSLFLPLRLFPPLFLSLCFSPLPQFFLHTFLSLYCSLSVFLLLFPPIIPPLYFSLYSFLPLFLRLFFPLCFFPLFNSPSPFDRNNFSTSLCLVTFCFH
jgi:hypothetical protein